MVKIENKITGYSVVKEQEEVVEQEIVEEVTEPVKKEKVKALKRPEVLPGNTYKIKNNAEGYNLYLTINYLDGKPFEVFFSGSHADSEQWQKGLTRLISAMLRVSDFDLEFVGKELAMIHSPHGYFAGKKEKYVSGIVSHVGKLLLRIAKKDAPICKDMLKEKTIEEVYDELIPESPDQSNPCPECSSDMQLMDGCWACPSCGWSKCG